MPSDEWIKALADGRRVKFTYQELPDEGAFVTAQVEGNKVVYSIVLTNVDPTCALRPLTIVGHKPSIVIEQATFSYSFKSSELSQPI